MSSDPTYCLFRCGARPLAMALEHVAEIAEVGPLVRISRCPPPIAGLFVYHQHVLPVLSLGGAPQGPDTVALVARTEAGLWALGIDRGGTQIVSERLAGHDPARGDDGLVTAGLIRRDGADHALVDAEATWRSFRTMIEDAFARSTPDHPDEGTSGASS